MFKQKQIQKNPPRIAIVSLMAIATAVILVFTLTPWNFVPVQVTEEVTVLGITEHGCVGESQYGTVVVVPQCSAQVGDVVTVQFQTGLFSVTGTSGSYQITNMPFTAQANVSSVGSIREYGQTGQAGFSYLSGGGTTLVIYATTTSAQVNNPYFYGTITYRVN